MSYSCGFFFLYDTRPLPPKPKQHIHIQSQIAKSSRSKCKKCKATLNKDQIRLVVIQPDNGKGFETRINFHPICYNLPRKYATGANKMTSLDFCYNILEDLTNGEILPAHIESIANDIDAKGGGANIASHQHDPITTTTETMIDNKENVMIAIKKAFHERSDNINDDDNNHHHRKNNKKLKTWDKTNSFIVGDSVHPSIVDCYEKYCKYKIDELKDLLQWNRQHVTGNKDILLHRVIDGTLRGRLPRCPLDGGRLKLHDDLTDRVSCQGSFDESSMIRLTCTYVNQCAGSVKREKWYVLLYIWNVPWWNVLLIERSGGIQCFFLFLRLFRLRFISLHCISYN